MTPSVIDFGTLPLSSPTNGPSGGLTSASYTNCSTGPELIYGRGTNASGAGGATWTLDSGNMPFFCEAGVNLYGLGVVGGNVDAALSLTDQELETVPAGASGSADTIGVIMPCVGSDGGGSVMSFQFIFTATF